MSMPNVPAAVEATLEVIAPDNTRHHVGVRESPFLIGRGEAGNHLPILDPRISRQCAAIVLEDGNYYLEDRGHRCGIKRLLSPCLTQQSRWNEDGRHGRVLIVEDGRNDHVLTTFDPRGGRSYAE